MKDDVKKAMQNIVTMEVEQRTKAWISQQQQPANSNSTQVTILENMNSQLKEQVSSLQNEKDSIEENKKMVEKDLVDQTELVMHAVTQVRTPDELQNIYKELLKLKTMMSGSFAKIGSPDMQQIKSIMASARK